jgi:hypothetical protein
VVGRGVVNSSFIRSGDEEVIVDFTISSKGFS